MGACATSIMRQLPRCSRVTVCASRTDTSYATECHPQKPRVRTRFFVAIDLYPPWVYGPAMDVATERTVTRREPATSHASPDVADLALEGMTCAACASRIERVLNRLPGVSANVNFAAEKARVRFVPGKSDVARLVEAVRDAGYAARPVEGAQRANDKARQEALYRADLKHF